MSDVEELEQLYRRGLAEAFGKKPEEVDKIRSRKWALQMAEFIKDPVKFWIKSLKKSIRVMERHNILAEKYKRKAQRLVKLILGKPEGKKSLGPLLPELRSLGLWTTEKR